MRVNDADVVKATRYQRLAADPRATRLASANAGSGKTKVLVERVSRLLLDGADPDKILCLTYTKAAASEMQTRLFDTLGKWSVMPKDELDAELNTVLGESLSRNDKALGKARQLFARALETPDGLKVQTIHAFCERVLSRFPIEAGVLPGFEPMEDADAAALRADIEEDIYRTAFADPGGEVAKSLQLIASEKANSTLEDLFAWMSFHCEQIVNWEKAGGVETLAELLNVDPALTVSEVYSQAWDNGIRDRIKAAAQSLMASGNDNDVKRAENTLGMLTEVDPVVAFEAYANLFLTQGGTLRKSVVTVKAPPSAQAFFGTSQTGSTQEGERVLKVVQNILAARCLERTHAVYALAKEYAKNYTRAKRTRRWLDFSDQILLVRDLLVRSEVADWVRYKLDGGIAHILVDEAQDTAPDQWEIIDALKESFSAPDPDWPKEKVKTFFAVGDEKQSIYSFQGARPELFLQRIRDYVNDNLSEAVTMSMSFRSSPDILRVVDAVFVDQKGMERMFNLDPLTDGSFQVGHNAFRQDRGLVELWPLAPRPEEPPEEQAWDPAPVDALDQSSSREVLARKIAEKIAEWLASGEPVYDRDLKGTRPMRPEDIIILVRRRNEFFDAVIRNLKLIGVPVAGADRLILKDAVVVKDLLALTRFILLPTDDLSLAEVLKSPFFAFTEEELFQTARRRGKTSLWDALQTQAFDKAKFAVKMLTDFRTFARRYAPYEFYAVILDSPSQSGESFLKCIYRRLGAEAQDALEAFLARALAHQRRGAPSLQHFLQSFVEDDQDIKREMDAANGEVRVMTVHGAKGLEAPVIFLPDTTQGPTSRTGVGVIDIGGTFAYVPSQADTPDILRPCRDAITARDKEEYMRLLYVAMTRAESRLIICGFESGHRNSKGYSDGSWFDEVSTAMAALEVGQAETPFGEGRVFGAPPETPNQTPAKPPPEAVSIPEWALKMAKPEIISRRYVTPSHLLAPPPAFETPALSPVTIGPDRFRRGNIIHKLLEILPDVATERRDALVQTFLDSHQDLSKRMKDDIRTEVFKVLEHPEYVPIFAPGSQAEVSLAGHGGKLPKGLYLNAQIDRLAVTKDRVYIIDYKSSRPPPTSQDQVADIYWGQMAAYRELAREIYPEHEIVCGLLWTDGPHLMILDDNRLDHALTLIASLPNYSRITES